MEHVIIRETSSEMRAIARNALRENWKKVALVMALYYFLMFSLPGIFDALIPSATITTTDAVTGELIEEPLISKLYSLILSGPFQLGLSSFCIAYFRRKDMHSGHLFDGFEHFLKAVLLTFAIGFFVFLWSLLFIIPGLIAAFRYSQAYYILADHPELSVGQCIRLSKEYMKGNKGKLFVFQLSFIGWIALTTLPVFPLLYLPIDGVALLALEFILSIPSFFYMAYNNIGKVVFYDLVSSHLMAKPDPAERIFPE